MTARVLYHQRSGIELEAQYTDWTRAVDFHPSQGDTVILSDWRYMDGGNAFTELPTYATGQTADYWGGWHDAGDWDRNHNHLGGASALLYVYEFNPPLFSDNELNIPESGNGIPDIIDEAAWTVDFMKRLQSPSGAVRGGLETTNHPREGESSLWVSSQS